MVLLEEIKDREEARSPSNIPELIRRTKCGLKTCPSYERQRHPCPLQEVSNCDIKRQHGKLVSNGYSKSNSHYALSIYAWISSIPSAYVLSCTSPAYYTYSHSQSTSKCWYF